MSHKPKDPIDAFIEGVFTIVFYIVWGVAALIVALVVKIVRIPPEKKLQRRNGLGSSQYVRCPVCSTPNDQHTGQCRLCGTKLNNTASRQTAYPVDWMGVLVVAGIIGATVVLVVLFT